MLLFAASDAGGARELIPVAGEARKLGKDFLVLSSSVTAPIFEGARIPSEQALLSSRADAKKFLQDKNIDALIVGTTGSIGNERYLTAAARELGIGSLAVLDEWYHYAQRFQDEEGNVGAYLPDIVCVQDDRSSKLAVKEGLPMNTLRITGSPALAALSLRASAFAVHPPEVPAPFIAHRDRPSILFLSQPLKKAYGGRPGGSGTHGTYLGFDEDSVRSDLAGMLGALHENVFVLEKLHPSEGTKSPPERHRNVLWETDAGAHDPWALLWHADCVIGIVTKALLEAAILGRKPISYQPNAVDPNLCTAVLLGLAELHTTKQSLTRRLPDLLQRYVAPQPIPELPFAHPDAPTRVLALVEEQAHFRKE
jgi:hypothetical protein